MKWLSKLWMFFTRKNGKDVDLTTGKRHSLNFFVDICWNGREDKKDTDVSVVDGAIVRVNENNDDCTNYIYLQGEFVADYIDYKFVPAFYTCKSAILHAYKTLAKHDCEISKHFFKIKTLVEFVKFVKSKHNIDEEELKKLSDVQLEIFIDDFLGGPVEVGCCKVKLVLILDVRSLEEELSTLTKRSEYEDAVRKHLKLYAKTDDRNYFTMDAPTLEIRFY